MRFWNQSASCIVVVEEDGIARVAQVYSEDRGKGHAKGLLQKVINFADENGLTLYLKVSAYGPARAPGLSNKQLVVFYEQFGFISRRNGEMIRTRKNNIAYSENGTQ